MTNPNTRWHLVCLVALVAVLLAVLNWRGGGDGKPLAAELEPGVEQHATREELQEPELAAPILATAESASSGRGTARTPLGRRVTVRGRLRLGTEPLAGQLVVLFPLPAAMEKTEDGKAPDGEVFRRLSRSRSKNLITQTTDDEGDFLFSGLEEGAFTLYIPSSNEVTWKAHAGDTHPAGDVLELERFLEAGEVWDLGEIDLLEGTLASYRLQMEFHPGSSLKIQSGQPGLIVRYYEQGSSAFHDGRHLTDENGDATLRRKQATAIRIDLLDRNGYVLGSTDAYHSYPTDLETIVPIPAVPGTLTVQLPNKAEIQPGEKVQFTLQRATSPAQHVIIKSMWGDIPPQKRHGLNMSHEGIEFLALRAGTYTVKAIRKIVDADGVLSTPTGAWMHATAHVYPGQVTTCRLK